MEKWRCPSFIFVVALAVALAHAPTFVSAAPNATRKRDEVRLVVTFKRELTATTRQSLHIELKMNFMRHFATTHSDLVQMRIGRTLGQAEARTRAGAICARYLRSPLVKTCVSAF